jgi:hypothetical protein
VLSPHNAADRDRRSSHHYTGDDSGNDRSNLVIVTNDPHDRHDQGAGEGKQCDQSYKDSKGIASAGAKDVHAGDRRRAGRQKCQRRFAIVHERGLHSFHIVLLLFKYRVYPARRVTPTLSK